MYITIQDFFYLTAIFFTSIIGTLLIIILIRVLKILRIFDEVFYYMEKTREIINIYASIPELIKNKVMEMLFGKK